MLKENFKKGFGSGTIERIGLAVGPAIFLLVFLTPIFDLAMPAKIVLGAALWMAVWWITGAVPLYVTAFLPLIIFPSAQIVPFGQVTINYADRLVFLLLGGLILAKAIEKSGLHERFALTALKMLPNRKPQMVIAAFMVVTASISAWICNTATTLMILPIALAVISQVKDPDEKGRFGTCLMLSIAFAASLGGIATLVGTPPNIICSSVADKMFGIEILFSQWVMIGIPVTAIGLLVTGWYMTNFGAKVSKNEIIEEKGVIVQKLHALGSIPRDQKMVIGVFAATATAWISHIAWKPYLPMVDDAMIAILAAVSLFLLPSTGPKKRILEKEEGLQIPWGVLLVIGGGLALAAGFTSTGLDNSIAEQLGFLKGMPPFIVLIVLVAVAMLVTQVVVNTAAAALLLPVAASLSGIIDVSPTLLLIPVAIAISFGFILPIGTPPNTVVLGSGYVTTRQMAKAGIPLTLIFVVVVSLLMLVLVPAVFG